MHEERSRVARPHRPGWLGHLCSAAKGPRASGARRLADIFRIENPRADHVWRDTDPIDRQPADTRLTGDCRNVRITGTHNDIEIEMAPSGTIEITGSSNDVFWSQPRLGPAAATHQQRRQQHFPSQVALGRPARRVGAEHTKTALAVDVAEPGIRQSLQDHVWRHALINRVPAVRPQLARPAAAG